MKIQQSTNRRNQQRHKYQEPASYHDPFTKFSPSPFNLRFIFNRPFDPLHVTMDLSSTVRLFTSQPQSGIF